MFFECTVCTAQRKGSQGAKPKLLVVTFPCDFQYFDNMYIRIRVIYVMLLIMPFYTFFLFPFSLVAAQQVR